MTEEQVLTGRLRDLAKRAYDKNIYTYSSFLSLPEQVLIDSMKDDLSFIPYSLDGGHELAERKVVGFGSEEMFGYPGSYPISVLKVSPVARKFGEDLNHRDYLGSLMSLGIDRKKFGDIFVDGMDAYIYADESTADYLLENFVSVGRNSVKCSISELPESYKRAALKEATIQVASPRADAVIARVYNLSRKDTLPYFTEKKVSVNGHLVENNDKLLSAGDSVSVRGFGKFNLVEEGGLSRKGKLNLVVEIFGK